MGQEQNSPSTENRVAGMPLERVEQVRIEARGHNGGWDISVHCQRPRGDKVILMTRVDSLDDALNQVHKELTEYREPA